MGTRSITVVMDKDGKKIIEMYRHMDGYPAGMGKDLQNFINSGKVVNGIPLKHDGKLFNGISCFAAQLVNEFKDGPGNIYLHAPTKDFVDKRKYEKLYGADYYYEIDSALNLLCWDCCNGDDIEDPTSDD